MEPRADLPTETLHLIDVLAKAIARGILDQLGQADKIIHQNASDHLLVSGSYAAVQRYEAELDGALTTVFKRKALHELGIRPIIWVDMSEVISKYKPVALSTHPIEPINQESAPEDSCLSTNNHSLVPVRLLQRTDRPITRDASKDFVEEICETVPTVLARSIKSTKDLRLSQTFERAKKLHRQTYNLEDDDACCVFQMLEEDYQAPSRVGKHEVTGFGFKCDICGNRHEVKVLR